MQQQLVEEYGRRKLLDVLAYGQDGGHDDVARFHHGVRYEQPFNLSCQFAEAFVHVGKIARDEQEGGHVERVDHLFRVRELVADVHQVENHHQHNEHAFQIVNLSYSVLHCVVIMFGGTLQCKMPPRGCYKNVSLRLTSREFPRVS